MIIGITGGSGAGKTTLLQLIHEAGGLVLDCDAIYHQLLATDRSLLSAIVSRFPCVVENECLNRKKLGEIVFSDPKALAQLNEITHKAIREKVLCQLDKCPTLAAIDAIALFESGLSSLCDLTVAVTAPESLRIQRLMHRDRITETYAKKRIAAQQSDDWFLQNCDRVLVNDGTTTDFRNKCLAFLKEYDIIIPNNYKGENVYDK